MPAGLSGRIPVHKSNKTTPDLEAGVTDRLRSMADIAALVPEHDAKKR